MPQRSTSADPHIQIGENKFSIEPVGPFSLREAALFGFGQRHDNAFDGTMRLAFCVDGFGSQVGVAVTQDAQGIVHGALAASASDVDLPKVVAQVARVLSLDKDANDFVALGKDDPLIAQLLAAAEGLRPPLFYSPYEAALWVALSARRPQRTGEKWRQQLSKAAGARFDVAGRELWAVPLPARIIELGVRGIERACHIETLRAERVLAMAHAAVSGTLDPAALASVDPDSARATLRTLPGIGPFYADLVLLRATGVTDVLSAKEPRFLALLGKLHGFEGPATPQQAEQFGERWSPWRTWMAVLVRAAGPRVLEGRHGPSGD